MLWSLRRYRKIPTKVRLLPSGQEIHIQYSSLDTPNIRLDFINDVVLRVIGIESVSAERSRYIYLIVQVDQEIFCCEGELVVGSGFGGGGQGGKQGGYAGEVFWSG